MLIAIFLFLMSLLSGFSVFVLAQDADPTEETSHGIAVAGLVCVVTFVMSIGAALVAFFT